MAGLQGRSAPILERWISLLSEHHVLMGRREAITAELGNWLVHLPSAADGTDPGDARELYKLVAFHARELGIEGRPASAAVMQVVLLEEALETELGPLTKPIQNIVREMLRVAADAHALGQTETSRDRHHKAIRDFSPVFRCGPGAVCAFLLGPMAAELIDSIVGRLLRECAATGANTAILDVFGADADDDRFHRTLDGFLRSKESAKLDLVLTGLRDKDATLEAMAKLGADTSRLRFEETIGDFFAKRVTLPPE